MMKKKLENKIEVVDFYVGVEELTLQEYLFEAWSQEYRLTSSHVLPGVGEHNGNLTYTIQLIFYFNKL